MSFNFEKLEVWRMSMDYAESIYRITITFPNSEKFGLTSQLQRAAISIPSNISEGAGRQYDKEFINFLYMAKGSLNETITQLKMAKRLSYLSEEQYDSAADEAIRVNLMLYKIIGSIKKRLEVKK